MQRLRHVMQVNFGYTLKISTSKQGDFESDHSLRDRDIGS